MGSCWLLAVSCTRLLVLCTLFQFVILKWEVNSTKPCCCSLSLLFGLTCTVCRSLWYARLYVGSCNKVLAVLASLHGIILLHSVFIIVNYFYYYVV